VSGRRTAGPPASAGSPVGPAGAGSTPARPRRDPLGYAEVLIAYLLMAGSAPLVAWIGAPESVVLCLRMALAALALGVVFLRRPMLADWRRPGAAWRLIAMALVSSATLLLFFFAVRHTSVAIAMFLLFLMPLWVTLVAPRVLHTSRDPIVWPALALALAGLAVILVPDLLGEGLKASWIGLLAAFATGIGYASYTLSVKGLTGRASSATISMAEAAGDAVIVAPLAVWQLTGSGYQLTGRDWLAIAVMGVLCTAVAYTLWVEGTRRVRVEHVTVLGYVEPVAGPLYAVLLLGQLPGLWTWVGGALILAAGLLVVLFGRGEGEASIAAAAEPGPL
jgi:drug/metabolite transporter (DMT)-like permease